MSQKVLGKGKEYMMLTYGALQKDQIYILSLTEKGGCFTEYNNIKQSTFASVIYPNGFGIQKSLLLNVWSNLA